MDTDWRQEGIRDWDVRRTEEAKIAGNVERGNRQRQLKPTPVAGFRCFSVVLGLTVVAEYLRLRMSENKKSTIVCRIVRNRR